MTSSELTQIAFVFVSLRFQGLEICVFIKWIRELKCGTETTIKTATEQEAAMLLVRMLKNVRPAALLNALQCRLWFCWNFLSHSLFVLAV